MFHKLYYRVSFIYLWLHRYFSWKLKKFKCVLVSGQTQNDAMFKNRHGIAQSVKSPHGKQGNKPFLIDLHKNTIC